MDINFIEDILVDYNFIKDIDSYYIVMEDIIINFMDIIEERGNFNYNFDFNRVIIIIAFHIVEAFIYSYFIMGTNLTKIITNICIA